MQFGQIVFILIFAWKCLAGPIARAASDSVVLSFTSPTEIPAFTSKRVLDVSDDGDGVITVIPITPSWLLSSSTSTATMPVIVFPTSESSTFTGKATTSNNPSSKIASPSTSVTSEAAENSSSSPMELSSVLTSPTVQKSSSAPESSRFTPTTTSPATTTAASTELAGSLETLYSSTTPTPVSTSSSADTSKVTSKSESTATPTVTTSSSPEETSGKPESAGFLEPLSIFGSKSITSTQAPTTKSTSASTSTPLDESSTGIADSYVTMTKMVYTPNGGGIPDSTVILGASMTYIVEKTLTSSENSQTFADTASTSEPAQRWMSLLRPPERPTP
ncbi:hypothetical protein N7495_001655 [Penicillium taxi]|uniref:uncharacterized protein n=1 Tax=Penicillium taxi TaxID=168475 RepID=UPI002544EA21|nr:uncharacterized protein N7495_001655 [Penicillium taxi]KAJ5908973.1 hypothetical protein N7495_001655 [Penicillium taxi]